MINVDLVFMCTVTFVPIASNKFVLTSNRDEAPDRTTLPPTVYTKEGVQLVFPKDELAGGTWIGLSEQQRLICLLNGGFTAHQRAPEYRMSRGVIVTTLLTTKDAIPTINAFDFNGIEPFTLIMADWASQLKLFELVWDGEHSHFTEKPLAPAIWSSSLLYTPEIKKKREAWFSSFLFQHLKPSEKELLHFHKNTGEGDKRTDLVMDRGFVKTKSITQVLKKDSISMRYEDLQKQSITNVTL